MALRFNVAIFLGCLLSCRAAETTPSVGDDEPNRATSAESISCGVAYQEAASTASPAQETVVLDIAHPKATRTFATLSWHAELADDGKSDPSLVVDVPNLSHHELRFSRGLSADSGVVEIREPASNAILTMDCRRNPATPAPSASAAATHAQCHVVERFAADGSSTEFDVDIPATPFSPVTRDLRGGTFYASLSPGDEYNGSLFGVGVHWNEGHDFKGTSQLLQAFPGQDLQTLLTNRFSGSLTGSTEVATPAGTHVEVSCRAIP